MKTHKNVVKEALRPLFLLKLDRRIVGSVISEFEKWVTNNGLEWAKTRMKAIKVDYIRMMNDQIPISGVRRSRKDKNELIPYGIFGKLFRMGEKHDAEILSLLNLYTRFPSIISDSHVKEAIIGISHRVEIVETQEVALASYLLGEIVGRNKVVKYEKPFLALHHTSSAPDLPLSWQARAYIPKEHGYSEIYRSSSPNRLRGLDGLETEILIWKMNKRLIMRDVPNFCKEFEFLEKGIAKMAIKGVLNPLYVSGEINFVQQNGKIRHVAAPYRFNQHLCRPLGDLLYSLLQKLPWDCTYDQAKALPWIQSNLLLGEKLWCFDLKKATDYIPLYYQYQLIREIIDPTCYHFLDIWKYISEGEWQWKEFPTVRLQWKCGQPLGLYPSFASFALFHGALLNALRMMSGGDFFIIGDDVVIKGDKLADRYEKLLNTLHIPISENKTLRRSRIAEFAGKIITANAIIDPVNWDYKPDNIIDLARRFGRRILSHLDIEAQKLLRAFGDLPYPYGADWFSNCNYSQKIYLVEELQKDHLVDGDSPEVKFRMKVLNKITGDMLDSIQEHILDPIIEDQDSRLGFAFSRLTRETCEKLWANRHLAAFPKETKIFLQRRWLRSLYPLLKTLDPSRNQD